MSAPLRRRTLAALLVSLAFAISPGVRAGAARPLVTAEDVLRYFASSEERPEPHWIAHSDKVVFFTVDAAGGPGPAPVSLRVLDVKSGAVTGIGEGRSPLPSPDGKKVAFTTGPEFHEQLWVSNVDGTNRRALTNVPGGLGNAYGSIFDYVWSPTSDRIAYAYRLVRPREPGVAPTQAQSTAIVLGKGGALAEVVSPSELHVVDVERGTDQFILSGPFLFRNLTWPRNDDLLIAHVEHDGAAYDDNVWWGEIRQISLADGRMKTLVKNQGVQSINPWPSWDGRYIAFPRDLVPVYYPSYLEISVYERATGKLREITSADRFHGYIESNLTWSPDDKWIYFRAKVGAFTQPYRVNLQGHIEPLGTPGQDVGAVEMSPDGASLIYVRSDAVGRAELVVAGADNRGIRVLTNLTPRIDDFELGTAREIAWQSDDGTRIAGIVVTPPGYRRDRRYPLIVDLHGGPTGGISLSGSLLLTSPMEWQMWASKGYIVLAADYRSSMIAGYGVYAAARRRGDFMLRDRQDILSGVDAVVRSYGADPTRLAVVGHSYGGTETNNLVTHTHRFRAAVSYEGSANEYSDYGTDYRIGGNEAQSWESEGFPWDVPGRYIANSPAFDVKGVTTPTLFIMAEHSASIHDYEFLYTAWLQQHVDTSLVEYRGEDHVISAPANQRDLLLRGVTWIDAHVGR